MFFSKLRFPFPSTDKDGGVRPANSGGYPPGKLILSPALASVSFLISSHMINVTSERLWGENVYCLTRATCCRPEKYGGIM